MKLTRCRVCGLPSILLTMPTCHPKYLFDKPWPEAQGPTTNKRVKKWCGGTCFRIILPLILELEALRTAEKMTTDKRIKTLIRTFQTRIRTIYKEQLLEIKKLKREN